MGQPIPERILNAPELLPGLELYLNAFFDLDAERSHAMAPTAIPWSRMVDYAKAYSFDGDQAEDLFYLVRHIDLANLKRLDAKMKRSTK